MKQFLVNRLDPIVGAQQMRRRVTIEFLSRMSQDFAKDGCNFKGQVTCNHDSNAFGSSPERNSDSSGTGRVARTF